MTAEDATEHRQGADQGFPGFSAQPAGLCRIARYDGAPGVPAAARGFAGDFLEQLRAEWLAPVDPAVSGDVLLAVSELVTNALRHARGPYALELRGDPRQVVVCVHDGSTDLPALRPHDPLRVGGHGLEIVTRVCTELTVERVAPGKQILARFDLAPADAH